MNTQVLISQAIYSFPKLQRLHKILTRWKRNISTRHKLLELDDGQLTDIGIDRTAAIIESSKPFWR